MKQIDTLKMYETLIAKGMSDKDAKIQIAAMDCIANDLLEWLKELKQDFASQKLVSILGGLILVVGVSTIGMMWKLSIDLEVLKAQVNDVLMRKVDCL